jgi:hypothetical protein
MRTEVIRANTRKVVALIAKPTNKAKEETEMCGEAKRVHSQGDINSVETA